MPNHFYIRVLYALFLLPLAAAGTAVYAYGEDTARAGEILVRFRSDVPAAELAGEARRLASADERPQTVRRALLSAEGATATGTLAALQVARVKIPAGRARADILRALRSSPLVEYCEPNYIRRACAPLPGVPNDPLYQDGSEWWPQVVKADRVVNENLLPVGSSVTIAVVDTGIMLSHEDLAGRLVSGADFVNAGGGGDDDNGHGTHVAGIAAAATNNGLGIAGTAGAAAVRLMPVKVLDSDGAGDDFTISLGVQWAADHGARVINLSLGGALAGQVLEDAVTYAHDRGCIVVAAAGNFALGDAYGNPPFNPTFYPAAYPEAIAVAACGRDGNRALYSEYGSYVDLAAPGGNTYNGNANLILSTWLAPNPDPFKPQTRYAYDVGTSMAAPIVAGAAALLLAQDSGRTPEQVENLLTTTAQKLGADAYADGWNQYLGWGVVDVYQALNRSATFTPKSGGRLSYNYPNPFAPGSGRVTCIVVPMSAGQVPAAATLRIYDAMGRPVRTLTADASRIWPGALIAWDGRNDRGLPVANGVYPYRLEINGAVYTNKIAVKN